MRLQSFSRAGNIYNEDSYDINHNYGFVLDGATGLFKEKVTNFETDVQWFTQEWKKYLQKNIMKNIYLKEIIKKGIEEVNDSYLSFEGASAVKSKPSSSIALFRIKENLLEYFLLGDCSLIIAKTNGEIIHLQPQEITKFDALNIKKLQAAAIKNKINVVDARPLIKNDLVKTRLTKNTKGGYWILSDSLEAVDNALYGTMNFSEIKQIIALSDGYSQIYDTFNLYTVENFSKLIESKHNLEEIYSVLWNLQEKDKYCNNYPRFKLRDDATIVVFSNVK